MPHLPTILQIIPQLDTGGAELATIEISEAVTRAGGRALVATEGGRLAGAVERAGGEIIPFLAATKNPMRMLANARALARLMAERDVALIHARSRAPAWSALLAARRGGRRFVTTYHGAYGNRTPLKDYYNGVMARGDLVIANSRFTADLIRARHGTPQDRIRVVNRGVDLDAFDPATLPPSRVRALRAAWGVADGETVVLQAARVTDWKGQHVVVEAAGRLTAGNVLRRTVIVLAGDAQGRDGYVRQLEERIAALGLASRVRLVGHCADMPAAFLAAHVSIVASVKEEAFGRVAAESLAMGCPVIATSHGAPAETVLATPTVPAGEIIGWLVCPGDAEGLAGALAQALALSPAGRAAMAARARRRIVEHYSLESMKRQTLAVYDELLGSDLGARFDAATARNGPASIGRSTA